VMYAFNHKYWDCKTRQEWSPCPDIYWWRERIFSRNLGFSIDWLHTFAVHLPPPAFLWYFFFSSILHDPSGHYSQPYA
jgi:hypothetical protein